MTSRPPNIILTIADDQRASALGCAGIEPVHTPNLDALAAAGTRFSNAAHLGSCHGAVCAPSRAMLHTGKPYFQLDDYLLGSRTLAPGQKANLPPTLGQRLREAGYHTFGTGKWHNGPESYHASFDSGGKIFFGGMCDHWFVPVSDFDATGRYPQENQYYADGFSTDIFANEAINYIQSRQGKDQPFFCYCAFTAPHDPRTPPDHWRRKYPPHKAFLPPNTQATPSTDTGELNIRDERLLGTPRHEAEVQRSVAEYYGMISHMDETIGRIYAALDAIGERENTIIVHTADHGLAVGQHGLLGKQNLYDHSLAVPLILAGPNIPANTVRDALCHQHELYPTLIEASGGQTHDSYFKSLMPNIKDPQAPSRTHIGSAYDQTMRMIRDAKYKLIEYKVDGTRRTELFDLESDPWELKNLSAHSEQQGRIQGLRQALKEWQMATGDSLKI